MTEFSEFYDGSSGEGTDTTALTLCALFEEHVESTLELILSFTGGVSSTHCVGNSYTDLTRSPHCESEKKICTLAL